MATEMINAPGPDVYRTLYGDLSLLSKVFLLIRRWFQGETVEAAVRHREYRILYRRLERDHHEIVDPAIPMLLEGFARRLQELAKRITVIHAMVEEVSGERSGRFLQQVLKKVNPEIAEQLEQARNLPDAMLDDHTITLTDANAALKQNVEEALHVHQATVLREVGPVWACIVALTHLSQVRTRNMLPSGSTRDARIPLRVVRDDLITLYRELTYARQHRNPQGLDMAVEFATQRLGRSFSLYRGLWECIDDLLESVPFVDIIRLSLEEPCASVEPVKHRQDWWSVFAASWLDSLDAGPGLLRHRSYRIETILHDDFSVTAPAITWVPVSLYQRTLGALRRLAFGPEFRMTRVFTGTIAREEGLLRPVNRRELLNAHVALDQQIDRMEDLIGSGDNRGKIGEEVKRLNASNSDAALVRIQMAGVLSKYRPSVRTMINEAIEALDSIQRVCATEEKTIVKGFPRVNNALADTLGETNPRYVLDLIIHRYEPLVKTLRGLCAVERDLMAGLDVEGEELLEAAE